MLLDDIKNMLDITMSDSDLDRKLSIIIEDSKMHLKEYAPDLKDEDFEKPGQPRNLLINLCRYAYSNAFELFDKNYGSELLAMRMGYEVRANADKIAD